MFADLTDGYTTNDIIYEWRPGGVVVGNGEMAQFEYKGKNISSDIDVFSVGKKYYKKSLKTVLALCTFERLNNDLTLEYVLIDLS